MQWTTLLDPPQDALARAMVLRYEVFVEEQSVPLALEQDGLDDQAYQVVVEVDGVCVATGRMMLKVADEGESPPETVQRTAKAQRIAVGASWRGKGAGRAVMAALEARAKELGATTMLLASQITAVGFYERLGYVKFGDMFLDAGIEHFWMELPL